MHTRRLATYKRLGGSKNKKQQPPATRRSYTGCRDTFTVKLSESTLTQLRAEAARRGVSIDVLISYWRERSLPDIQNEERKLSFIGLGTFNLPDITRATPTTYSQTVSARDDAFAHHITRACSSRPPTTPTLITKHAPKRSRTRVHS